MVLNAAVQMLREADELKTKILKFKSGTSMLQERSLWALQQQLQQVYQKVLILDLDYSLEKKVEQDLWNVGFKLQIEALQSISKDRKNPLRSEGQAMLSWVLQTAAGFYLCLLHQICTTFKLDLPFRRRASLLGLVECWGAEGGTRRPAAAAARYVTQHCLVHLGDLARYRHQLKVAHTFYKQAVGVCVECGQPYNQLALVRGARGRRLAAAYWHVRSLLVRAPFPPARNNLASTLRAAACRDKPALPVIPGVETDAAPAKSTQLARLDSHTYVNELLKAMHMLHTLEELDVAEELVKKLNSSLTTLVALDSFDHMTLIKMAVILIWLVHSSTDGLSDDKAALTESERKAATLSAELAASAMLALLLPAYTAPEPPPKAMPALKVWVQWCVHCRARSAAALAARPQLYTALAHTLNALAGGLGQADLTHYDTIPLPEDEELHGFLPLEDAFKGLKFASHAAWDTYGGSIPDIEEGDDTSPNISTTTLSTEPELERKVRALRLVNLGVQLADIYPDHLSYTVEDSVTKFTATPLGGDQLSAALAELTLAREAEAAAESENSSPPPPPPPPLIISEADFREKVREKRVGILKPQGSLERAREERAMALTQDEQDGDESEEGNKDDKKDPRKSRVNIAMAAIMRKQEETNKQVKFVTPPPTPNNNNEVTPTKEQPKVIHPKAIKSLANLPLGRKTGGILSLKDKSAGYPHLVNTEPEPVKKPEKDEKVDAKTNTTPVQNNSGFQIRQELPPTPSWPTNMQPANIFNEGPRLNFQKNYGIQNAGLSYNPTYQNTTNIANQGIRLPVVNPKEIDVRTAALQKQNSRQELFQDSQKNYPMSNDKKNFLNDLPPRFANQYRYWQVAQENQFENKFKDDSFKNNTFSTQQRPNWMGALPEYQPTAMNWWKPDNQQTNFNSNYTPQMNLQPNYYSTQIGANITNPYSNIFNPQSPVIAQPGKPDNLTPGYLQPIQPQMQTLQNLVTTPNFNSMAGFGSYPQPPVGYDAAMYPQFNNFNYPNPGGDRKEDLNSLNFRQSAIDTKQRNLGGGADSAAGKSTDIGGVEAPVGLSREPASNTYSLFSAAEPPAWAAHTHPHQQSLWSGPGPSPLERLLEQQKHFKQPQAPQ